MRTAPFVDSRAARALASLEDLNAVTAYLNKRSPVAKTEMHSVGDDQAVLRMHVRSGREFLALGGRRRPEPAEPGSGALRYRQTR